MNRSDWWNSNCQKLIKSVQKSFGSEVKSKFWSKSWIDCWISSDQKGSLKSQIKSVDQSSDQKSSFKYLMKTIWLFIFVLSSLRKVSSIIWWISSIRVFVHNSVVNDFWKWIHELIRSKSWSKVLIKSLDQSSDQSLDQKSWSKVWSIWFLMRIRFSEIDQVCSKGLFKILNWLLNWSDQGLDLSSDQKC